MSTLTAGTMRELPPRTYAANTREAQRWLVAGTAHPAKMHPHLARDLFLRYTLPGQTVLDPFFGRGTSLLGCTLGRNVIGVELEPPFCGYARDNWRHLRANSLPLPGVPLGWALVLRGDSRRLPLRSAADVCISSPPFADCLPTTADQKRAWVRANGKPQGFGASQFADYGHTDGQIGALPHGDVAACLSSPPYADLASRDRSSEPYAAAHPERDEAYGTGAANRHVDGYGASPGQIGNLPAAAITSPPYEAAVGGHRQGSAVGGHAVDEVAASAARLRAQGKHAQATALERKNATAAGNFQQYGYSTDPANIGNQDGEDYASACLAVYRECYRVCRPGAVLVLVTGNYVRAGAIVDLAADTIALAQAAGWTPWERWEHRKSQVSFWRILHHSQGRPIVAHEDVLVFCKGPVPGWDFAELEPTNRAPLDLERGAAGVGAQQAALPLEWEAAGE